MTIRMILNAALCQGYANCLIEAPEIWDFDEETDIAVLKVEYPDDNLVAKAHASVRGCPAHAISVEEQV